MTLRQLEVFLAVARERSFGLAARAIHLSQPTLSEHVRQLEDEVGARLLDRRGRFVTLTEAGRVFQPYALRAVTATSDGRRALAEVGDLQRGFLQIGASTTPGIYVLPRVVGAFRARLPGIELRLDIANSAAIEARVQGNDLDLGVVGGHGLAPGKECLAAGLADELVLIVPAGHPWARRRQVAPERLIDHPLIVREPGSATRRVTERALEGAGVAVRLGMELGHTEAIKQAVIAGLGVAFVSVHAVRGEVASARLRALRIRGLRIHRHFHVIHNEARPLTASAKAFLQALQHPGRPPARSPRPAAADPARIAGRHEAPPR